MQRVEKSYVPLPVTTFSERKMRSGRNAPRARSFNAILGLAAVFLTVLYGPASAATIPTVPVGNPGNAPDPATGNRYGSVSHYYRIGTTEVTNAQYVEFLNAVAKSDPYELYVPAMDQVSLGGITRSGVDGSYVYSVKADSGSYTYANKPVLYVSWGDAVRFANWLHNGQPTGPQDSSTTEDGAYTLNGATTSNALLSVVRNADATWFIPSENEWYKAAYYDGDTSTYYNYPTGSNIIPDEVLPSSDTGNSGNYYFTEHEFGYPLTDAGAYTLSASHYGTYDQGGNLWEWNESFVNPWFRGVRGGSFYLDASYSAAAYRSYQDPAYQSTDFYVGFRVATVPEPSSFAIAVIGAFGLAFLVHRGKKIHR